MDMSKIKNVFGKLAFVRNYSAYILPIVLTVVAVGLVVVGSLVNRGLEGKIGRESIKLGKQVADLSSQGVAARQWQVEKQYQDKLGADANGISNLLKETSQRQLLSYKIFPEPKDKSVLIFEQFGQRYQDGIEKLIAGYGARECPTEAEIEKALQQTRADVSQPTSALGAYDSLRSTKSSNRSTDRVEQMIIDELCQVAARKASFYASPLDVAGYEYWGKAPSGQTGAYADTVYSYQSIQQSVEACWYWQLGYWIIEDVLETIGAVNSRCGSVLDCPVKRLMEISFGSGSASAGVSGSTMSAPPSYVRSPEDGLTSSHTGRVSNDQMDVVHFKAVVLINPRFVLPFIDKLCSAKEHTFKGFSGDQTARTFKHNQITVLDVDVNPVDLDASAPAGAGRGGGKTHELYRYGDDAVVEMELICEYVFERAGYEHIEPEFIKNASVGQEYQIGP